MLADIQSALNSQLGAALTMAESAVHNCPDEVWSKEIRGHKVWHVIYHALVYVDFYVNGLDPSLVDPSEEYCPSPVFMNKEEPPFSLAESSKNATDKEIMLDFIEYIRSKTNKMITNCPQDRFLQQCGFYWLDMNNLELVIYFIRHLAEHIGQVSAYIRERHDVAVPWASQWAAEK